MSLGVLKFVLILFFFSNISNAESISNEVAVLKLLDKTTNKVSKKMINVNHSDLWESLYIKVFACYSSPPDEIPEDYVLLQIKDTFNESEDYIYQGWMISSSPDISPLEHPIYDLWLIDCN